ncbi:spinster family MFS transporter [Sphingomonas immobilis]|uniref:MFS transporter n=1 Tax=Sphingomonas immobilis TaxID=3063997 RepID=A0ABT9A2I0_9SPHN|nr:MFS transporter [Sphingomonas sp. CA1-15]MDO7844046.1 MFS transporter [Sphingomonas sp. CA1-15]
MTHDPVTTAPLALSEPAGRPDRRRHYYLALFVACFAVLTVDRSIVSILLEPIKAEFHLSDTQLGFMTGIGFAICFGLAGIPLGRLADHVERRKVLAPCIAFFSLMTVASGLAVSFPLLLLTRFLVGAGEAGGQPAIVSMLSDLFPGRQRATAMGIYYLGVPIGSLVIFLAGAPFVAAYGWRAAFYLASVPGLLIAFLVWTTLKEPVRGASGRIGRVAEEPPSWKASFGYFWTTRSVRHIMIAGAVMSIASAGIVSWIVSFMIRSHGLALSHAGILIVIGYVLPTALGAPLGGLIVDRLARSGVEWRAIVPGIALIATVPIITAVLLTPSLILCVTLLALWGLFNAMPYGSMLAALQAQVPLRLRGLVVSTYYSLTYVVGVGLGPQFVGLFSDWLKPVLGQYSLAWGMVVVGATSGWAGIHLLLASRTLRAEQVEA